MKKHYVYDANEQIRISAREHKGDFKISIYDKEGKIISHVETNSETFDLEMKERHENQSKAISKG